MVKDPYKEWDRVYTFCTLLADLEGTWTLDMDTADWNL